jgi:uncharacterized protein YkwD
MVAMNQRAAVLLLLAITGAAAFAAGLGAGWAIWGRKEKPRPTVATRPVSGQIAQIEARVLELVNRERAGQRLGPVRPEAGLAEVARIHSLDMLRRKYMAHENPEGEGPADRVARGHRSLLACKVSENLALRTTSQVVTAEDAATRFMDGWMKSPGHRANILDGEVDTLGVGVVQEGGELRGTQVFAKFCGNLTTPLPPSAGSGGIDVAVESGPAEPGFWTTQSRSGATRYAYRPGQPQPLPAGAHQLHVFFPEGGNRYHGSYGPRFVVR